MRLDTKGEKLTLTGTPDEFAEFIGFPDYDSLEDLRSAISHVVADTKVTVTVPLGQSSWTIQGSWRDFAELIGGPDLFTTKEEMIEGFRSTHPSVEIV